MKNSKYAYPYILWMSIFIVIPLILIIYFAFTDINGSFTLDNLSKSGEFLPVFIRSINLSIISTIICLIIGYPLAFIFSQMNIKSQKTFILLIMLPMWMNFLLRTYSWMTILENNGILNKILEFFGFNGINIINTQLAVVLGMVYNYLPFMILPLYSVMVKIDKSIIEAASDLGASRLNILIKILIPLSKSGITTGITMVFVPSISTFIISRLLGGGSNLLIGDLIELQFLGNTYNPNLGSAIAIVLMVIILICTSLMNQFDTRDEDVSGGFII